VSPYYNKPNRSGMLAHYHAVADATELPIMLYNVPGRTGQNLGAELILELARIERIVAVKEASGNLEQIAAIVESRPPGFGVFSGDDALALPTVALGADGLVSVVSNEAPGEIAALLDAALAGRLDQARAIHYRLLPLMRANFLESNPVPVKTALEILGRCSGRVRSPLGPAAASTVDAVRRALRSGGLGTAGA
jgi:4-hydroxy-tetrahydrodipicolinate synthase